MQCKLAIDSYIPSLRDVFLKSENFSGLYNDIDRTHDLVYKAGENDVLDFIRKNPARWDEILENPSKFIQYPSTRGDIPKEASVQNAVASLASQTRGRHPEIVGIIRSMFSESDVATIYREMYVTSIGDFVANLKSGKQRPLGVYWTFTKEKAHAYWLNDPDMETFKNKIRVGAAVGCDDIDYIGTFASWISWSKWRFGKLRSEDEIRLVPGRKVIIVEICHSDPGSDIPYKGIDCSNEKLVAVV